jgi:carbonic anhydrase
MQKLVQGVHHFQAEVFEAQRDLFDRLSKGQEPDTLFITCSDSRIDPNLITQTEPGELFIIRNVGNIIPTYSMDYGGVTAAVEYAVCVLNVRNIIICGHSLCGAINALLDPHKVQDLPAVSKWLGYAESTRRIIKENYCHLHGDALTMAAIEENVLNQIENLATHPAVASRLSRGDVHLHGWVYKIETGQVFSYDPQEGQFVPLKTSTPIIPRPIRKPVTEASAH